MKIDQATNMLITLLSKEDFTIQRYDAYGTNSVYLKLDYGLGNSIRISDHRGKKHLKYRYNVLTCHREDAYTVVDGFIRHYYASTKEQIQLLIEEVLRARETKIDFMSTEGYAREMENTRMDNRNTKGFWRNARLIHKGAVPKSAVQRLNDGVIKW